MKKENDADFGFFRVQDKTGYGWIVSCLPAVVVLPLLITPCESDSSEQSIDVEIGLIQVFRHPIGQVSWEFPGGNIEGKERQKNLLARMPLIAKMKIYDSFDISGITK